jgi:hypothetical protein
VAAEEEAAEAAAAAQSHLCSWGSCVCAKADNDDHHGYTVDGLLRNKSKPDQCIVECNHKCGCHSNPHNCVNRVVQNAGVPKS